MNDERPSLPRYSSRCLPRYFAALPLLALLTWLPLSPYWQSDDFLALHYAGDLRNVLADFVGPQYGATDVWLFYRPLITLSFWLDQQLAGAAPYLSHLSNVLAHAVSTLLFALLARRFLGDRRAFAAAALWTVLPSHVGSLAWAVGRVDSHTTVWCLSAVLLFVRQCERANTGNRAPRWPALLCFLLALASKELAFVVPPLAIALGLLTANGPARARAAFALRQAVPMLVLFALYLGWRQFVLGRLGGYLAGDLSPWPMLVGLCEHVLNLACPWRWAPGLDRDWWWLAALPALVASVWAACRWRAALGTASLFALAAAPMAPFFADAGNVHNLRYFYLPSLLLAALLASRSAALAWLALAAVVWPLVTVREAQRAADLESAAMHAAILREAHDGAPSPMFVAGLPHQNLAGTAVQLHFGVDRMLAPPFADDPVRLYALRPLATGPGIFQLPAPDGVPAALPTGSTWFFAGSDAFVRAPEGEALPELVVHGDDGGVLDFSTPRLLAIAGNELAFGLTTHPGRPQGYRLTLFTANGYLACLFFDHGRAGDDHGTIDARKLLAGDRGALPPLEPARYGMQGAAYLGEALPVPTTIDRDTEFPALLESGSWQDGRFVPTARARRLLRFRFDRGYAAWARLVQGKS